MKITRDNYEIYMIDFFDNNLSKEQAAEMQRFLDANPDIKEEAEGISNTSVADETVRFPHKNKLKAIAQKDDFDMSHTDYLCVADLEGDITKEEKDELTKIAEENENLLDDLALFAKTRLQANKEIVFSQKEQLKDICKEAHEELKRADYLAIASTEGDITEEEAKELETLLEEQPELKDELDAYEKIRLTADENIVFTQKELLKDICKEEHEELKRADYLAIASAEGDITEDEAKELEALLEEQPELKDELAVYENTKLEADKTIVYEDKSALKQRLTMAHYKFTYTPVAVAASIVAVFFILGNLLTPKEVLNVGSMAKLDFSEKVRTYEYHEAESEELPVANTYVEHTQYASNIQTATDNAENRETFNDEYRPADILKTETAIPRAEAHVYAQNERVEIPIPKGMPKHYYDEYRSRERNPKNQAWMIAEKGVDIWRTMTSSDVMMANSYNDNGDIERLNIQGTRLEITRTFYDK
jgi:hypothetical protein